MAADGGRFQCVTGGSSGAAACFFFEFLMLIRPQFCENRGSKN